MGCPEVFTIFQKKKQDYFFFIVLSLSVESISSSYACCARCSRTDCENLMVSTVPVMVIFHQPLTGRPGTSQKKYGLYRVCMHMGVI